MCSTDNGDTGNAERPAGVPRYPPELRRRLLTIALSSIEHGLRHGTPLPVDPAQEPPALGECRASFVTLKLDQALRGCIGSLEAYRPLCVDVAGNAYAAAFLDPRFPALSRPELERLTLHIAVLSQPESLDFTSEHELIAQLRPHVDGLILEDGPAHRATFLPAVWESLPDPADFVRQLKLKAGLPAAYWSDTLRASRYVTETFSASYRELAGRR